MNTLSWLLAAGQADTGQADTCQAEDETIAQIIARLVKLMGFHYGHEINDDGLSWVFSDKFAFALGGTPEQTYIMDSDAINHRLPAHEWVVYDGRHYDVETPEGVANPLDLPFFKRRGLPTWFIAETTQQQVAA